MRRHAAALLATEIPKNIETAVGIRDDTTQPGRTRLAAAEFLTTLAGVTAGTMLIEPGSTDPDVQPVDLATLSDDELVAYLRRSRRGS